MEQVVNNIIIFIESSGLFGPVLCCFLIVIESIFPVLPLAVFIALNALFFGHIIGFILSWFFTICGCILSYLLFKNKFRSYFDKKLAKDPKVQKFMQGFKKLSFSQLVIVTAIPFSPAFLINIIAGLTGVSFKKFLAAIMIAKVSIVVFWGYIGTSFLNSFKDPTVLIKVTVMLLLAYIVSRVVSNKYDIK